MKRAYEVLVGILASRSGIANGIDSNRTGFRDINHRRRRAVVDLVAEEVMRSGQRMVSQPCRRPGERQAGTCAGPEREVHGRIDSGSEVVI